MSIVTSEAAAAPLPDSTRLALDRTRLAFERTTMAWVRTATTLRVHYKGVEVPRSLAVLLGGLMSILGVVALLAAILRR